MQWKPISAAPIVGKFLLWQPGRDPYIGERDDDGPEWWTDEEWANDGERMFPPDCEPTHFMALPPPPQGDE